VPKGLESVRTVTFSGLCDWNIKVKLPGLTRLVVSTNNFLPLIIGRRNEERRQELTEKLEEMWNFDDVFALASLECFRFGIRVYILGKTVEPSHERLGRMMREILERGFESQGRYVNIGVEVKEEIGRYRVIWVVCVPCDMRLGR
jgi:hypothetical protein